MLRSRTPMASALLLTGLVLMTSCRQDATAPSDQATILLSVVSGDGQSGIVGTELPQALVIQATNSKTGNPIRDLVVNFRVTSGGGSLFAGVAATDKGGNAADYWTLGISTAEAQQVEVRAVSSSGEKQVLGVFTATALPGPAAQIAKFAGDSTAPAGTTLANPPAVIVHDLYFNPVPGVTVTFTPAPGSGSVTGGTTITNASGIATVGSWTISPTPGTNTLTATATGSGIAGNPVTFTVFGLGP